MKKFRDNFKQLIQEKIKELLRFISNYEKLPTKEALEMMKELIEGLDSNLHMLSTKITENFEEFLQATDSNLNSFKFFGNFNERMKFLVAKNKEELLQFIKKSKWDFYPNNIDLLGESSSLFISFYYFIKFWSHKKQSAQRTWENFKNSYKGKILSMEIKLQQKVEDSCNLLESSFKEVSAIYVEINKK